MSAATSAPTSAAFAALGLVASLAKPKGRAADAKQRFSVNLPELQPHVDGWIGADNEMDRAKSLRQTEEDQILSVAVPQLIEQCRRAGKVETSIRINNAITLTRKNQYCPLPDANIDEVRKLAGVTFPRYFAEKLKIELTAEAAADEAFLQKLLGALGPGEFAARFNVTRSVVPTEEFHRAVTLDRAVADKAAPLLEQQIIRPYKPSLRQ
jgi:hypothetical protein